MKFRQSGISWMSVGMEWHLSHQELQKHDGNPFCEVDQPHLSALPGLLCAGGKERYVGELLQHVRGCGCNAERAFAFPLLPVWHLHKSRRNQRAQKAAEKLDPAWEKSFSLAPRSACVSWSKATERLQWSLAFSVIAGQLLIMNAVACLLRESCGWFGQLEKCANTHLCHIPCEMTLTQSTQIYATSMMLLQGGDVDFAIYWLVSSPLNVYFIPLLFAIFWVFLWAV